MKLTYENKHPDAKKVLRDLFMKYQSKWAIENDLPHGLYIPRKEVDTWPYRIITVDGMESYPREYPMKWFAPDVVVVAYGEQLDHYQIAIPVGRRDTYEPILDEYQLDKGVRLGAHNVGGRMFTDTPFKYRRAPRCYPRSKDNTGYRYLGGTIFECPLSGCLSYEYHPMEMDLPVGRYIKIAAFKVSEEDFKESVKDARFSPVKYKLMTTAKSRDSAYWAYRKYNNVRDFSLYGRQLQQARKEHAAETRELKDFLFSCGLKRKLPRNKPCLKKDIVKTAKRRMRRKKLTKREQEFFSTMFGASILAGKT